MKPDPISQLPEPYRLAWEILQKPFDDERLLGDVLTSAQRMAGADWGMIVLAEDIRDLEYQLPEFRTLPDCFVTTIPVGHVCSLAYALGRNVVRDGRSVLIPTTEQLDGLEIHQLIDQYFPPSIKETIARCADQQLRPSPLLEIPRSSDLTIMVLPMIVSGKNMGAIYLQRPENQGAFTEALLEKIDAFLACVGIGIKNAGDAMRAKLLALEFPYTASVELKTPVISMRGFAELLHKHATNSLDLTDEDVVKFSKFILDNANRMLSLMNDLLLYVKVTRHQIGIEGVKPNDVLNPILEEYRPLLQEKKQTLVLDIPELFEAEVKANYHLSAVIEALIKNAYLYTPKGGEIKISARSQDGMFHFAISDTGCGLTDKELLQVFQRSYRSDRREVRSVPGNGLGLFLAKRLVETWGGQIEAESTPNQGSTFRFRLLLKQD